MGQLEIWRLRFFEDKTETAVCHNYTRVWPRMPLMYL